MCSNPCESEVTCFWPESNRGPYGLLNLLCAALSTTELWWRINHRKSFRTLIYKKIKSEILPTPQNQHCSTYGCSLSWPVNATSNSWAYQRWAWKCTRSNLVGGVLWYLYGSVIYHIPRWIWNNREYSAEPATLQTPRRNGDVRACILSHGAGIDISCSILIWIVTKKSIRSHPLYFEGTELMLHWIFLFLQNVFCDFTNVLLRGIPTVIRSKCTAIAVVRCWHSGDGRPASGCADKRWRSGWERPRVRKSMDDHCHGRGPFWMLRTHCWCRYRHHTFMYVKRTTNNQPRPFEEWIEKRYRWDTNLCGACARPTGEHALIRWGGGCNQGSCVYFAEVCGGWVFACVKWVVWVAVCLVW